MHPTRVSRKGARTAPAALSSSNIFLTEGARVQPHAFPMSFHSFLLCGAQALRGATRWTLDCCSPRALLHYQHSLLLIMRIRSHM